MGKRNPKPRHGVRRTAAATEAPSSHAPHAASHAMAANDEAGVLRARLTNLSDLALLLVIKARIEQFPAAPQDATREQLEAFAAFVIEKSARLMSAVSMGNVLAESVLALAEGPVSPSTPSPQQPPAITTGG